MLWVAWRNGLNAPVLIFLMEFASQADARIVVFQSCALNPERCWFLVLGMHAGMETGGCCRSENGEHGGIAKNSCRRLAGVKRGERGTKAITVTCLILSTIIGEDTSSSYRSLPAIGFLALSAAHFKIMMSAPSLTAACLFSSARFR